METQVNDCNIEKANVVKIRLRMLTLKLRYFLLFEKVGVGLQNLATCKKNSHYSSVFYTAAGSTSQLEVFRV